MWKFYRDGKAVDGEVAAEISRSDSFFQPTLLGRVLIGSPGSREAVWIRYNDVIKETVPCSCAVEIWKLLIVGLPLGPNSREAAPSAGGARNHSGGF